MDAAKRGSSQYGMDHASSRCHSSVLRKHPEMRQPGSWRGLPTWRTAFSAGEARVTHTQNVALFRWVASDNLFALWEGARQLGLASTNVGLLTDMIACPGGDFCALANARSLPLSRRRITERYQDLDELDDLGEIDFAHQRLHQLVRPSSQRAHRHFWASTRTARSGIRSRSARARTGSSASGAAQPGQGDRTVVLGGSRCRT